MKAVILCFLFFALALAVLVGAALHCLALVGVALFFPSSSLFHIPRFSVLSAAV
jgi:hypothetical protein